LASWPDDLPLAKYFISPGNLHGKPPFNPIPLDLVAATIAVKFGVVILNMYINLPYAYKVNSTTDALNVKREGHLDGMHCHDVVNSPTLPCFTVVVQYIFTMPVRIKASERCELIEGIPFCIQ